MITETLTYAARPTVARRSVVLALIVGSLLSAVNQAEPLARGDWTAGLLVKIFFNYMIPFTVSSISAAANRPQPDDGGRP